MMNLVRDCLDWRARNRPTFRQLREKIDSYFAQEGEDCELQEYMKEAAAGRQQKKYWSPHIKVRQQYRVGMAFDRARAYVRSDHVDEFEVYEAPAVSEEQKDW